MGRKRKQGDRYPSGKLKPASPVDKLKPTIEPISGVLWQRLRRHGKQLGLDPRLATELGRLNMFGELTLAQAAAGFRVAEIYGRFEGFKELNRSARSPSYNATFGDARIAEELLDPDVLERLEERIRSSTSAFFELVGNADLRLPGHIRRNMLKPIEDLCVEDRPISPALYPEVRVELDYLARIWKISTTAGPNANHHSSSPSRRNHTPLHFNAHESEGNSAPTASKPKPNLDRIYWLQVIGKLRPDLDAEQLAGTYDLQQAMKQREIVRRSVAKKSGKVVPIRGRE